MLSLDSQRHLHSPLTLQKKEARTSGPTCFQKTEEEHSLSFHLPYQQPSQPTPLPKGWRAEGPYLPFTFLLGDQVLHDDISHAIPVSIPVLVEPMDSTENKLVEGNGAILAAYHLQGKRVVNSQLSVEKDSALPVVRNKCQ